MLPLMMQNIRLHHAKSSPAHTAPEELFIQTLEQACVACYLTSDA